MRRNVTVTVLLLAVLIIRATAQEPVSDTLLLKGVEIASEKISRKELSSFPMQSLSGNQIAAVAGNSVADALRTFSGVTLRDYGGAGGLKTVMVRSLGAQHTGVFIDGAPVSDIASGQPDLGKFPLGNLEEVSLNVGGGGSEPMPARARAGASIINLRSIRPDFGKYKTRGNIGIKGGSFGLFNPFFRLDHKTGQDSWIGIDVNPLFSKGDYSYLVDNGPAGSETLKRGNGDLTSLSANLRFFSRPGDSTELRVFAGFYNAERGLPGAVVFYNPHASQRLTNKDLSLGFQLMSEKKRVSLLTNAGWSYAWLRYLDPDYLGYTYSLDNRYLQQEFYLSQAGTIALGRHFSASLASDFILNTFSGSQYKTDPWRGSFLLSAILAHQTRNTGAEAGILASVIKDSGKNASEEDLTHKVSPYFSVSVRIADVPSLRLRMMYKHSFRMPAFNELYYALVGNPRLFPESAQQLNTGILGSYAPFKGVLLRMSADAFFNRVHNKIVAIPTQNLFVWSMQNIGEVSTGGLDFQLDATAAMNRRSRISVNLAYTFQKASDISDKNSSVYGNQIPYIPYETFSAMFQFGYRAFSLDYNVLFNGYRYVSAENIPQNLLPSWWISDAGVAWNPEAGRYKYRIKAGVTNLFDKDYVVIRSFPMPGRGILVSGTFTF
ncbi:TonB-dependent receptor [Lentimicrobium sp.]|uniref:TonB-dependent receptor n=1 Tax=Lentimicrobium sp. TaxID=2034841 RepID=UPI00345E54DA